eukprot:scaffold9208_cov98-Isochrysis_galbana.AAC.4
MEAQDAPAGAAAAAGARVAEPGGTPQIQKLKLHVGALHRNVALAKRDAGLLDLTLAVALDAWPAGCGITASSLLPWPHR